MLPACVTPPTPHPSLKIPEGEFLSRIDTFCISGVGVRLDLDQGDQRARELEEFLAARLAARGFETVSSKETDRIWERALESGEGMFDPHTGMRIDDRYAKFRERFLGALASELGCDALISGTVVVVQAPFVQGTVSWDHVEESLVSNLFAGLHAYGQTGWVSALSLWIRVIDLQDREIYFRAAGIQSLFQVNTEFMGSTAVPTDESAILSDAGRNERAVRSALEELPTGRRASRTGSH